MDTCQAEVLPPCEEEYYFGVEIDTSTKPEYGKVGKVKKYPYLCPAHTEAVVKKAMDDLLYRRCSQDTITITSFVGAF